jgi:Ca-activated chloride channel family protein
VKVTAEEPVSTFSIDVDTASYSFVRNSLLDGVLPRSDAVRVEELVNYFAYDYPPPDSPRTPFATTVSLLPTPWNADTRLLHIGIKGFELKPEKPPRANLVFLIDTSGSMSGPDRLPLVVSSFGLLLDALSPEDTVAIVTYAGSVGTALEPTRAAERAIILASLESLVAGGSTAGGEGLRQAYQLAERNFVPDGVNRVILATDGDFNVGIADAGELKSYVERRRSSGVLLSVLGFGAGNYNDELMQALAQNGNGSAAYIDNLMEAQKVLVEEATSTLFPIAKDVKIQVEFNPAAVSEYRLIGYETRLLAREDFRNDKVDAGDVGSGQSVTALYELTMVGSGAERVTKDKVDAGDVGSGQSVTALYELTMVGSGAERVPPLRYGPDDSPAGDIPEEYAFVKIRYKLPDSDTSETISRPVTRADEGKGRAATLREARFAAAVAGFGQLLRDKRHTGDFGYDEVIALARTATGGDPFGYRGEFIRLASLAKSAAAMAPFRNDRDSWPRD